ncbi:ferredoxin reductase precursor [Gamsiella multidivaricata]|uniref:ferredoxin reductase precursor n=1 Tax=Gamsiella multidivaricata TaxID=101098 RepID=UPI00221E76D8|nr:ferredoxin reductase precursor [Gamsiella multidivaricata]KAG0370103.1 NADPH-adrenodoxin reductase [Gamsiella multidivaricata]KAI7821087.1 ferredoxin reductase precursor [Gamsiella multidivaricata]
MIRLSLLTQRQCQAQGRRYPISPARSITVFTPIHSLQSARAFSTSWRSFIPESSNTSDGASSSTETVRASRSLRVAVIGSGPGGFYTAHRILKNVSQASIDMFEALPVPHGLVRFGVAPDHPEVKNVMHTFDEVAQNPNFTFIGNTSVGTFIAPGSKKADLEISDLRPHYDAIILAYGAHEDRLLGIPNEQSLKGVMAARSFVGFYNGLPSEQDLEIDLSLAETAVVIGQGNVALDVARILLTPLDELKKTDLTEKMIRILEKSRVKHVHVIGRRGPLEVAFTAKELREMLHLPNTTFHMDADLLASEMERAGKSLDRPRKRLMGLLEKGIKESKPDQPKSWSLMFLRSPLGFQGDSTHDQLKAIELGINHLEGEDHSRKAVATGQKETLECGLAFRSIGYKSVGIQGIPFDERRGIVPNMDGKVMDADRNMVPGLYAAGWLKRGPIGVIASTMADAYQTGDTIIADWRSGQPMLNSEESASKEGGEPVLELLRSKGHKTVSYEDWKKIEQKEFELGAKVGKPREKFLTTEEMLKAMD